jgi:hypothetical protein
MKIFILECTDAYTSLPVLWNFKSKEYSNFQKEEEEEEEEEEKGGGEDAHAILFNKYRDQGPEANREDITKKFNSLCTNFRKEINTTNSEKSGTGSDGIFSFLFHLHTEEKSNGHTSSICITRHHVITTTNYCTTWLIVLLNPM